MKKKCLLTPIAIIIVFILLPAYLFMDYYNFPTAIGVDVSRFNMDLLGIVSNALIAIAVFALGYYLIEQKNLKRLTNQKLIAETALHRCYNSCLYFSDLLERYCNKNNPLNFETYSKMLEFISLFDSRPFDEEALIQQYTLEGLLTKEQNDSYLSIKNAYKTFVFLKINPDFNDNQVSSVKKSLEDLIHQNLPPAQS